MVLDTARMMIGPLDGEPVPCTLETLDEEVVRVRVPLESAPEPTSTCAVWFSEGPDGASVIVPVVVGWSQVDEQDRIVDLFFAEPGVPSALWDESRAVGRDRRTSMRIAPAPDELEVYLDSSHGGVTETVPVRVLDLSAGGMCVDVPADRMPTMPFTDGVFQILLPGQVWPCVMQAFVRHRCRRSADVVRVGLEFDEARTNAYETQAERICQWIARRRQEVAAVVLRD